MKKYLPLLFAVFPLFLGFVIHQKSLPVLPSDSNTWFSGSGLCVLCHDTHDVAMRDSEGNDVSPVSQWRSTMLANASKDPFWLAKVKHEGLENPSHQEDLENVCTRCHAPMGMINAFMNNEGNYTLEQLSQDVVGQDGISCTVCHQISDFSSPEFSGVFEINLHKDIYGPYPNPLVQQMLANTGYRPVHNDQITNSRLCGSCHTLFTNSVFEDGEYTGEVFIEQALYHEWENSRYPDDNIGCQTCHMPRIQEPIKISSRPGFLSPREPYGLHTLTGGNLFMLQLLKDNHDELGLHSGEELLQKTIERTSDMLTNETIDLTIEEMVIENDTVYVNVSLKNKAGHKFPTGFPSRRAYLECVVTHDGNILFHSGNRDAQALTNTDVNYFEPHYEMINSEEQVQIYEFVMGNTEGEVTTVLERAHIPLKDNRILPEGFSHAHQNYDTVQVVGNAIYDLDYHSSEGVDRITYAIPLSLIGTGTTVNVALHYETVPENWLHQMFAYADEDQDIDRFRQMYEAADNTPVEIASDTKTIPFTIAFHVSDSYGQTVDDAVITFNGTTYEAGHYVFLAPGGAYSYMVSLLCHESFEDEIFIDEDVIIDIQLSLDIVPGDANGDGIVNVLDIITINSYYTGEQPVSFCFHNADVNEDGMINVLDIIGTVNVFGKNIKNI